MKNFTLMLGAVGLAASLNAQLINPGFESGIDPGFGWSEFSTNFITPLCDATCGDCGGGCAPQAGTFYAWFGGATTGTAEEGHISQQILFTNGSTASLSFYVMVGNLGDGGEDRCDIYVDNTRSEERRVGKECRSRWSPDLLSKQLWNAVFMCEILFVSSI